MDIFTIRILFLHVLWTLTLTFIDVAENRILIVARACFDEVSPLISFPPQWLIYLKNIC